jgi:hypothetical protein
MPQEGRNRLIPLLLLHIARHLCSPVLPQTFSKIFQQKT